MDSMHSTTCPLCASTREERDELALKVADYQSRLAMIRVEAKDQTLRTPFVEAVDRIVGFEAFAALAFRDARTLSKGRIEGRRAVLLELADKSDKHYTAGMAEWFRKLARKEEEKLAAHAREGKNEPEEPRSLLRPPSTSPPPGCHCTPGRCMAPVVMGKQTPCRDPEKARATQEASNG